MLPSRRPHECGHEQIEKMNMLAVPNAQIMQKEKLFIQEMRNRHQMVCMNGEGVNHA